MAFSFVYVDKNNVKAVFNANGRTIATYLVSYINDKPMLQRSSGMMLNRLRYIIDVGSEWKDLTDTEVFAHIEQEFKLQNGGGPRKMSGQRKLHTGPRGGKYILKNGKKIYK